MHRHGAHSLAERAAWRATSNQHVHLSDVGVARRYSYSIPKRSAPAALPHDDFEVVEHWTKRLIGKSNLDGKKGWKTTQGYGGEAKQLAASLSSKKHPLVGSSMEKELFLSAPSFSDSTYLEEFESQPSKTFEPGTLIEIRRNDIVSHAIVLYGSFLDTAFIYYSLSVTGELWPHTDMDIMFAISSFMDQDLVERCGREIDAQDEHQLAARVHALKRLRGFEVALERKTNVLSHSLVPLYEKCCAEDPNAWSQVTENEVARMVDPYSNPIPLMTKFVVHKHLFKQHKHFVAESRNFSSKQSFWVRPRHHLADLNLVDTMVLRRDPRLLAFIGKAKRKILASRAVTLVSWTEPPSEQLDTSMEFTPDDRLFIRYFQHANRSRRTIQEDPYQLAQSDILKRIDLYTGDIDDAMCSKFLSEIGVLPPWEDVITRGDYHDTLETPPLRMPKDKPGGKTPSLVMRPQSAQPLGPEDVYPHDIAESIRHDFGDLPVYVIDDAIAEELDDGISIESVPSQPEHAWIHVHVADPTSVIPPTHIWARHALRKVGTAYWVDRTIPMLPRHPLIDQCSLGSRQKNGMSQPTLTFSLKVNEAGRIIDYAVRAGLVKNVTTLTYADVDAAMGHSGSSSHYPFGNRPTSIRLRDTSPIDIAILKDLTALKNVAGRILADRIKHGAIAYSRNKVEMFLPSKPLPSRTAGFSSPSVFRGFPEVIYSVTETLAQDSGSRGMVSEFMKAASRVASCFFRDRGLLGLRRAVGTFQTEVEGGVEQLLASRDSAGYVNGADVLRFRTVTPSSWYQLTPGPHGILGIPASDGYLRVTSPLRRFSDMVAHWQIKHTLVNSGSSAGSPFTEQWLLEFIKWLTYGEDRMKRAAVLQQNFWAVSFIQRWMAGDDARNLDRPDPLRSLVGRIIGTMIHNRHLASDQINLDIPALGLRAILVGLDKSDNCPLGDEVAVKIDTARCGLRPYITVTKR
ncbi:RNB-domain-containing protein [Sparassis crispa]|uniref:RNB-domain-containing protein n=1 Tax=Sparassis crispa TaxID=139825 RepID=A0A401H0T1_9APHY|nr:RNB-domain-containing protein [Sparassis crispa]GBE88012.1 RNB-domain-containing protein [Sparassis crispa]